MKIEINLGELLNDSKFSDFTVKTVSVYHDETTIQIKNPTYLTVVLEK